MKWEVEVSTSLGHQLPVHAIAVLLTASLLTQSSIYKMKKFLNFLVVDNMR